MHISCIILEIKQFSQTYFKTNFHFFTTKSYYPFSEALHLEELRAIVLDYNWRDTKSKRIIDIPDVKTDLLNLMKEFLLPHIINSKCQIGIL